MLPTLKCSNLRCVTEALLVTLWSKGETEAGHSINNGPESINHNSRVNSDISSMAEYNANQAQEWFKP